MIGHDSIIGHEDFRDVFLRDPNMTDAEWFEKRGILLAEFASVAVQEVLHAAASGNPLAVQDVHDFLALYTPPAPSDIIDMHPASDYEEDTDEEDEVHEEVHQDVIAEAITAIMVLSSALQALTEPFYSSKLEVASILSNLDNARLSGRADTMLADAQNHAVQTVRYYVPGYF